MCSKNKYFISCCLAFPRWYFQALKCGPPDAEDLMTELFVWARGVCVCWRDMRLMYALRVFPSLSESFSTCLNCGSRLLLPIAKRMWHTRGCSHVPPSTFETLHPSLCTFDFVYMFWGLLWWPTAWQMTFPQLGVEFFSGISAFISAVAWCAMLVDWHHNDTLPLFFSISNSPGGSQPYFEMFKINKIKLFRVANTKWKQGEGERLSDTL